MNKAYQNMRDFWLDVKNLENKKGIEGVGPFDVCIAGVEMAMPSPNGIVKNVLAAASVMGDCSLYFENESKSGLGGMIAGSGESAARALGFKMIGQAAKLPAQMQETKLLPPQQNPFNVTLFVATKDGRIFYKELPEADARNTGNPFYAFFAYSQQLLGAFRAQTATEGQA